MSFHSSKNDLNRQPTYSNTLPSPEEVFDLDTMDNDTQPYIAHSSSALKLQIVGREADLFHQEDWDDDFDDFSAITIAQSLHTAPLKKVTSKPSNRSSIVGTNPTIDTKNLLNGPQGHKFNALGRPESARTSLTTTLPLNDISLRPLVTPSTPTKPKHGNNNNNNNNCSIINSHTSNKPNHQSPPTQPRHLSTTQQNPQPTQTNPNNNTSNTLSQRPDSVSIDWGDDDDDLVVDDDNPSNICELTNKTDIQPSKKLSLPSHDTGDDSPWDVEDSDDDDVDVQPKTQLNPTNIKGTKKASITPASAAAAPATSKLTAQLKSPELRGGETDAEGWDLDSDGDWDEQLEEQDNPATSSPAPAKIATNNGGTKKKLDQYMDDDDGDGFDDDMGDFGSSPAPLAGKLDVPVKQPQGHHHSHAIASHYHSLHRQKPLKYIRNEHRLITSLDSTSLMSGVAIIMYPSPPTLFTMLTHDGFRGVTEIQVVQFLSQFGLRTNNQTHPLNYQIAGTLTSPHLPLRLQQYQRFLEIQTPWILPDSTASSHLPLTSYLFYSFQYAYLCYKSKQYQQTWDIVSTIIAYFGITVQNSSRTRAIVDCPIAFRIVYQLLFLAAKLWSQGGTSEPFRWYIAFVCRFMFPSFAPLFHLLEINAIAHHSGLYCNQVINVLCQIFETQSKLIEHLPKVPRNHLGLPATCSPIPHNVAQFANFDSHLKAYSSGNNNHMFGKTPGTQPACSSSSLLPQSSSTTTNSPQYGGNTAILRPLNGSVPSSLFPKKSISTPPPPPNAATTPTTISNIFLESIHSSPTSLQTSNPNSGIIIDTPYHSSSNHKTTVYHPLPPSFNPLAIALEASLQAITSLELYLTGYSPLNSTPLNDFNDWHDTDHSRWIHLTSAMSLEQYKESQYYQQNTSTSGAYSEAGECQDQWFVMNSTRSWTLLGTTEQRIEALYSLYLQHHEWTWVKAGSAVCLARHHLHTFDEKTQSTEIHAHIAEKMAMEALYILDNIPQTPCYDFLFELCKDQNNVLLQKTHSNLANLPNGSNLLGLPPHAPGFGTPAFSPRNSMSSTVHPFNPSSLNSSLDSNNCFLPGSPLSQTVPNEELFIPLPLLPGQTRSSITGGPSNFFYNPNGESNILSFAGFQPSTSVYEELQDVWHVPVSALPAHSQLALLTLELFSHITYSIGKYKFSIVALESAHTMYELKFRESIVILRRLSELCLAQNDAQRALYYHYRILQLALQEGNVSSYVYVTQEIAKLYQHLGSFRHAEDQLRISISFLLTIASPASQSLSQEVLVQRHRLQIGSTSDELFTQSSDAETVLEDLKSRQLVDDERTKLVYIDPMIDVYTSASPPIKGAKSPLFSPLSPPRDNAASPSALNINVSGSVDRPSKATPFKSFLNDEEGRQSPDSANNTSTLNPQLQDLLLRNFTSNILPITSIPENFDSIHEFDLHKSQSASILLHDSISFQGDSESISVIEYQRTTVGIKSKGLNNNESSDFVAALPNPGLQIPTNLQIRVSTTPLDTPTSTISSTPGGRTAPQIRTISSAPPVTVVSGGKLVNHLPTTQAGQNAANSNPVARFDKQLPLPLLQGGLARLLSIPLADIKSFIAELFLSLIRLYIAGGKYVLALVLLEPLRAGCVASQQGYGSSQSQTNVQGAFFNTQYQDYLQDDIDGSQQGSANSNSKDSSGDKNATQTQSSMFGQHQSNILTASLSSGLYLCSTNFPSASVYPSSVESFKTYTSSSNPNGITANNNGEKHSNSSTISGQQYAGLVPLNNIKDQLVTKVVPPWVILYNIGQEVKNKMPLVDILLIQVYTKLNLLSKSERLLRNLESSVLRQLRNVTKYALDNGIMTVDQLNLQNSNRFNKEPAYTADASVTRGSVTKPNPAQKMFSKRFNNPASINHGGKSDVVSQILNRNQNSTPNQITSVGGNKGSVTLGDPNTMTSSGGNSKDVAHLFQNGDFDPNLRQTPDDAITLASSSALTWSTFGQGTQDMLFTTRTLSEIITTTDFVETRAHQAHLSGDYQLALLWTDLALECCHVSYFNIIGRFQYLRGSILLDLFLDQMHRGPDYATKQSFSSPLFLGNPVPFMQQPRHLSSLPTKRSIFRPRFGSSTSINRSSSLNRTSSSSNLLDSQNGFKFDPVPSSPLQSPNSPSPIAHRRESIVNDRLLQAMKPDAFNLISSHSQLNPSNHFNKSIKLGLFHPTAARSSFYLPLNVSNLNTPNFNAITPYMYTNSPSRDKDPPEIYHTAAHSHETGQSTTSNGSQNSNTSSAGGSDKINHTGLQLPSHHTNFYHPENYGFVDSGFTQLQKGQYHILGEGDNCIILPNPRLCAQAFSLSYSHFDKIGDRINSAKSLRKLVQVYLEPVFTSLAVLKHPTYCMSPWFAISGFGPKQPIPFGQEPTPIQSQQMFVKYLSSLEFSATTSMNIAAEYFVPLLMIHSLLNLAELRYLQYLYCQQQDALELPSELPKTIEQPLSQAYFYWHEAKSSFFAAFVINNQVIMPSKHNTVDYQRQFHDILRRLTRTLLIFDRAIINNHLDVLDTYSLFDIAQHAEQVTEKTTEIIDTLRVGLEDGSIQQYHSPIMPNNTIPPYIVSSMSSSATAKSPSAQLPNNSHFDPPSSRRTRESVDGILNKSITSQTIFAHAAQQLNIMISAGAGSLSPMTMQMLYDEVYSPYERDRKDVSIVQSYRASPFVQSGPNGVVSRRDDSISISGPSSTNKFNSLSRGRSNTDLFNINNMSSNQLPHQGGGANASGYGSLKQFPFPGSGGTIPGANTTVNMYTRAPTYGRCGPMLISDLDDSLYSLENQHNLLTGYGSTTINHDRQLQHKLEYEYYNISHSHLQLAELLQKGITVINQVTDTSGGLLTTHSHQQLLQQRSTFISQFNAMMSLIASSSSLLSLPQAFPNCATPFLTPEHFFSIQEQNVKGHFLSNANPSSAVSPSINHTQCLQFTPLRITRSPSSSFVAFRSVSGNMVSISSSFSSNQLGQMTPAGLAVSGGAANSSSAAFALHELKQNITPHGNISSIPRPASPQQVNRFIDITVNEQTIESSKIHQPFCKGFKDVALALTTFQQQQLRQLEMQSQAHKKKDTTPDATQPSFAASFDVKDTSVLESLVLVSNRSLAPAIYNENGIQKERDIITDAMILQPSVQPTNNAITSSVHPLSSPQNAQQFPSSTSNAGSDDEGGLFKSPSGVGSGFTPAARAQLQALPTTRQLPARQTARQRMQATQEGNNSSADESTSITLNAASNLAKMGHKHAVSKRTQPYNGWLPPVPDLFSLSYAATRRPNQVSAVPIYRWCELNNDTMVQSRARRIARKMLLFLLEGERMSEKLYLFEQQQSKGMNKNGSKAGATLATSATNSSDNNNNKAASNIRSLGSKGLQNVTNVTGFRDQNKRTLAQIIAAMDKLRHLSSRSVVNPTIPGLGVATCICIINGHHRCISTCLQKTNDHFWLSLWSRNSTHHASCPVCALSFNDNDHSFSRSSQVEINENLSNVALFSAVRTNNPTTKPRLLPPQVPISLLAKNTVYLKHFDDTMSRPIIPNHVTTTAGLLSNVIQGNVRVGISEHNNMHPSHQDCLCCLAHNVSTHTTVSQNSTKDNTNSAQSSTQSTTSSFNGGLFGANNTLSNFAQNSFSSLTKLNPSPIQLSAFQAIHAQQQIRTLQDPFNTSFQQPIGLLSAKPVLTTAAFDENNFNLKTNTGHDDNNLDDLDTLSSVTDASTFGGSRNPHHKSLRAVQPTGRSAQHMLIQPCLKPLGILLPFDMYTPTPNFATSVMTTTDAMSSNKCLFTTATTAYGPLGAVTKTIIFPHRVEQNGETTIDVCPIDAKCVTGISCTPNRPLAVSAVSVGTVGKPCAEISKNPYYSTSFSQNGPSQHDYASHLQQQQYQQISNTLNTNSSNSTIVGNSPSQQASHFSSIGYNNYHTAFGFSLDHEVNPSTRGLSKQSYFYSSFDGEFPNPNFDATSNLSDQSGKLSASNQQTLDQQKSLPQQQPPITRRASQTIPILPSSPPPLSHQSSIPGADQTADNDIYATPILPQGTPVNLDYLLSGGTANNIPRLYWNAPHRRKAFPNSLLYSFTLGPLHIVYHPFSGYRDVSAFTGCADLLFDTITAPVTVQPPQRYVQQRITKLFTPSQTIINVANYNDFYDSNHWMGLSPLSWQLPKDVSTIFNNLNSIGANIQTIQQQIHQSEKQINQYYSHGVANKQRSYSHSTRSSLINGINETFTLPTTLPQPLYNLPPVTPQATATRTAPVPLSCPMTPQQHFQQQQLALYSTHGNIDIHPYYQSQLQYQQYQFLLFQHQQQQLQYTQLVAAYQHLQSSIPAPAHSSLFLSLQPPVPLLQLPTITTNLKIASVFDEIANGLPNKGQITYVPPKFRTLPLLAQIPTFVSSTIRSPNTPAATGAQGDDEHFDGNNMNYKQDPPSTSSSHPNFQQIQPLQNARRLTQTPVSSATSSNYNNNNHNSFSAPPNSPLHITKLLSRHFDQLRDSMPQAPNGKPSSLYRQTIEQPYKDIVPHHHKPSTVIDIPDLVTTIYISQHNEYQDQDEFEENFTQPVFAKSGQLAPQTDDIESFTGSLTQSTHPQHSVTGFTHDISFHPQISQLNLRKTQPLSCMECSVYPCICSLPACGPLYVVISVQQCVTLDQQHLQSSPFVSETSYIDYELAELRNQYRSWIKLSNNNPTNSSLHPLLPQHSHGKRRQTLDLQANPDYSPNGGNSNLSTNLLAEECSNLLYFPKAVNATYPRFPLPPASSPTNQLQPPSPAHPQQHQQEQHYGSLSSSHQLQNLSSHRPRQKSQTSSSAPNTTIPQHSHPLNTNSGTIQSHNLLLCGLPTVFSNPQYQPTQLQLGDGDDLENLNPIDFDDDSQGPSGGTQASNTTPLQQPLQLSPLPFTDQTTNNILKQFNVVATDSSIQNYDNNNNNNNNNDDGNNNQTDNLPPGFTAEILHLNQPPVAQSSAPMMNRLREKQQEAASKREKAAFAAERAAAERDNKQLSVPNIEIIPSIIDQEALAYQWKVNSIRSFKRYHHYLQSQKRELNPTLLNTISHVPSQLSLAPMNIAHAEIIQINLPKLHQLAHRFYLSTSILLPSCLPPQPSTLLDPHLSENTDKDWIDLTLSADGITPVKLPFCPLSWNSPLSAFPHQPTTNPQWNSVAYRVRFPAPTKDINITCPLISNHLFLGAVNPFAPSTPLTCSCAACGCSGQKVTTAPSTIMNANNTFPAPINSNTPNINQNGISNNNSNAYIVNSISKDASHIPSNFQISSTTASFQQTTTGTLNDSKVILLLAQQHQQYNEQLQNQLLLQSLSNSDEQQGHQPQNTTEDNGSNSDHHKQRIVQVTTTIRTNVVVYDEDKTYPRFSVSSPPRTPTNQANAKHNFPPQQQPQHQQDQHLQQQLDNHLQQDYHQQQQHDQQQDQQQLELEQDQQQSQHHQPLQLQLESFQINTKQPLLPQQQTPQQAQYSKRPGSSSQNKHKTKGQRSNASTFAAYTQYSNPAPIDSTNPPIFQPGHQSLPPKFDNASNKDFVTTAPTCTTSSSNNIADPISMMYMPHLYDIMDYKPSSPAVDQVCQHVGVVSPFISNNNTLNNSSSNKDSIPTSSSDSGQAGTSNLGFFNATSLSGQNIEILGSLVSHVANITQPTIIQNQFPSTTLTSSISSTPLTSIITLPLPSHGSPAAGSSLHLASLTPSPSPLSNTPVAVQSILPATLHFKQHQQPQQPTRLFNHLDAPSLTTSPQSSNTSLVRPTSANEPQSLLKRLGTHEGILNKQTPYKSTPLTSNSTINQPQLTTPAAIAVSSSTQQCTCCHTPWPNIRLPCLGMTYQTQLPTYKRICIYDSESLLAPPIDTLQLNRALNLLDASAIYILLAALLNETRVLIVSSSPNNIQSVIDVMLALIYPFRWQSLRIPLLHRSSGAVLHQKKPYLVGCLTPTLEAIVKQHYQLQSSTIYQQVHGIPQYPQPNIEAGTAQINTSPFSPPNESAHRFMALTHKLPSQYQYIPSTSSTTIPWFNHPNNEFLILNQGFDPSPVFHQQQQVQLQSALQIDPTQPQRTLGNTQFGMSSQNSTVATLVNALGLGPDVVVADLDSNIIKYTVGTFIPLPDALKTELAPLFRAARAFAGRIAQQQKKLDLVNVKDYDDDYSHPHNSSSNLSAPSINPLSPGVVGASVNLTAINESDEYGENTTLTSSDLNPNATLTKSKLQQVRELSYDQRTANWNNSVYETTTYSAYPNPADPNRPNSSLTTRLRNAFLDAMVRLLYKYMLFWDFSLSTSNSRQIGVHGSSKAKPALNGYVPILNTRQNANVNTLSYPALLYNHNNDFITAPTSMDMKNNLSSLPPAPTINTLQQYVGINGRFIPISLPQHFASIQQHQFQQLQYQKEFQQFQQQISKSPKQHILSNPSGTLNATTLPLGRQSTAARQYPTLSLQRNTGNHYALAAQIQQNNQQSSHDVTMTQHYNPSTGLTSTIPAFNYSTINCVNVSITNQITNMYCNAMAQTSNYAQNQISPHNPSTSLDNSSTTLQPLTAYGPQQYGRPPNNSVSLLNDPYFSHTNPTAPLAITSATNMYQPLSTISNPYTSLLPQPSVSIHSDQGWYNNIDYDLPGFINAVEPQYRQFVTAISNTSLFRHFLSTRHRLKGIPVTSYLFDQWTALRVHHEWINNIYLYRQQQFFGYSVNVARISGNFHRRYLALHGPRMFVYNDDKSFYSSKYNMPKHDRLLIPSLVRIIFPLANTDSSAATSSSMLQYYQTSLLSCPPLQALTGSTYNSVEPVPNAAASNGSGSLPYQVVSKGASGTNKGSNPQFSLKIVAFFDEPLVSHLKHQESYQRKLAIANTGYLPLDLSTIRRVDHGFGPHSNSHHGHGHGHGHLQLVSLQIAQRTAIQSFITHLQQKQQGSAHNTASTAAPTTTFDQSISDNFPNTQDGTQLALSSDDLLQQSQPQSSSLINNNTVHNLTIEQAQLLSKPTYGLKQEQYGALTIQSILPLDSDGQFNTKLAVFQQQRAQQLALYQQQLYLQASANVHYGPIGGFPINTSTLPIQSKLDGQYDDPNQINQQNILPNPNNVTSSGNPIIAVPTPPLPAMALAITSQPSQIVYGPVSKPLANSQLITFDPSSSSSDTLLMYSSAYDLSYTSKIKPFFARVSLEEKVYAQKYLLKHYLICGMYVGTTTQIFIIIRQDEWNNVDGSDLNKQILISQILSKYLPNANPSISSTSATNMTSSPQTIPSVISNATLLSSVPNNNNFSAYSSPNANNSTNLQNGAPGTAGGGNTATIANSSMFLQNAPNNNNNNNQAVQNNVIVQTQPVYQDNVIDPHNGLTTNITVILTSDSRVSSSVNYVALQLKLNPSLLPALPSIPPMPLNRKDQIMLRDSTQMSNHTKQIAVPLTLPLIKDAFNPNNPNNWDRGFEIKVDSLLEFIALYNSLQSRLVTPELLSRFREFA